MESLSEEQLQKCKENKEKWYDNHIRKMEIGKEVQENSYGCMNFYTKLSQEDTEKKISGLDKTTEKCRFCEELKLEYYVGDCKRNNAWKANEDICVKCQLIFCYSYDPEYEFR